MPLSIIWRKANKELKVSKEETKKTNEQVEDIKKKMADKDAINKLHIERMSKME